MTLTETLCGLINICIKKRCFMLANWGISAKEITNYTVFLLHMISCEPAQEHICVFWLVFWIISRGLSKYERIKTINVPKFKNSMQEWL